MRNHILRRARIPIALVLLAVSVGCYTTQFKLIDLAQAKVDHVLCGDWRFDNMDNPNDLVTLSVRNIDDHQFALDWMDEVDGKAEHYVAFVGDVNGVHFAHVRPLAIDGTLADKQILVRFDVANDTMTLRQLDEGFFHDKTIDSDASLRKVLTDNLQSDAMYATTKQVAHRVKETQP